MRARPIPLLLVAATAVTVMLSTGCKRCTPAEDDTAARRQAGSADEWSETATTVKCPVCGLSFSPKDAVGKVTYHGVHYYFYLEDHLNAFKENPEAYLEPLPIVPDSQNRQKNGVSP